MREKNHRHYEKENVKGGERYGDSVKEGLRHPLEKPKLRFEKKRKGEEVLHSAGGNSTLGER